MPGKDTQSASSRRLNHFTNASLAIGGDGLSEHDDFALSFSHGAAQTPFDVLAVSMQLVGNDHSEGEALRVYRPDGTCMAALHGCPARDPYLTWQAGSWVRVDGCCPSPCAVPRHALSLALTFDVLSCSILVL